MDKIRLKLWLMRLPLLGRPIQMYFVNRLAEQERALSKEGSNNIIFSKIYQEKLWAENAAPDSFYSGTGTHSEAGKAYVAFVVDFIKKNGIKSMTDIGSGDFAIGNAITGGDSLLTYHGVDVAKEVVEHNERTYGNERIKFYYLDASKQNIPPAELLTIRQVLQHLSNTDVAQIVKHISKFKYALITEHVLDEPHMLQANIDKPSGKSTRAGFGSAVLIDQPPFNISCIEVLRCRDDQFSHIITYLVDNTKVEVDNKLKINPE